MKVISILAIIFGFFLTTNSIAQWNQLGPEGGYISKIIQIESSLIVSAGNGGLFRSDDGGDSWKAKMLGLPEEASIQVLTESDGTLYICIYQGGIYKSDNKGDTWIAINTGIENLTCYSLTVKGNEIYAGNANGGVYYSPDSGQSWTEKSAGIESEQMQDFAFFNSKIYAGGRKLYESSNNGTSWTEVAVPDLSINGIRSLASTENDLYLTDDGGFFHYNEGTGWNKSNINTYSSNVCIGISGDSVFFTTSFGNIFYTKDNGISWHNIINNQTNEFANCAIFLDDKIIMSTNEGLYTSVDGGINWTYSNTNLNAQNISSFAENGDYIFAGGNNLNGLYRSDDRGENWLEVITAYVYDIVALSNNNLLIATDNGIYTSSDNGINWDISFDSGFNTTQALDYGNTVLATAVNGKGVYLSIDTAKTWNLADTTTLNIQTSYSSIEVVGDTIIVATDNSEIFLSTNLGESWDEVIVDPNQYYFPYGLDYYNGTLYVSTSRGLFYSSDFQQPWNLTLENLSVLDIEINKEKIYAATGEGIFFSGLQRDEWIKSTEGLGSKWCNALIISNEEVYVGTYASSVWKRPISELNLPPLIKGQNKTLSTLEDTPIELHLSDLIIDDPDNNIPEDISLQISAMDNYTVVDGTILPKKDFNGVLTAKVIVNDGTDNSEPYNIFIEVIPVNDIPEITGLSQSLSVEVNTSLAITIEDFVVVDPDDEFPADFALTILDGDNYNVENNTITPTKDFVGKLTLKATVNDGKADSEPYEFVVEVSDITGIDDQELARMTNISPNPATKVIKISTELKEADISIYDNSGHLIIQSYNYKSGEPLEIGHLDSGIYIIQIRSAKQLIHQRLFKQ